ncbi:MULTISPECIES: class I SAM-dependent methyltransferase [unclassified Prochlorococcus]|uniref:class I SAM-dependent methyltransferase n=4 Tax=Prochlorococcaceae TaxID=2881426 RepID=UPI001F0F6EFE|nr:MULTISPECIES: class I SAM-dependent methyltransferase [unclassified Prochlorococcus]
MVKYNEKKGNTPPPSSLAQGEQLHTQAVNYHMRGHLENAERAYNEAIKIGYLHEGIFSNLGVIRKNAGNPYEAIDLYKKAIKINPNYSEAHANLGNIYKELGNLDLALASTLKSVELKPENPIAFMILSDIYQGLGNSDLAIGSTLKSIELNPNNPSAHVKLGEIYQDLGNFDQALDSTLKSLTLKPINPSAFHNLKKFYGKISLNPTNAQNVTQVYELLLHQKDISHRDLSNLFLQAFLSTIQAAGSAENLITQNNIALNNLAADWRFRKSLTLLIPPYKDAELFFTRLRKEILIFAIERKRISPQLELLSEALATQCYLNEYCYNQSIEETKLLKKLIDTALESQDALNKHLAIISCYVPILQVGFRKELICNYPITSEERQDFINVQFHEPEQEKTIKAILEKSSARITDSISQNVQKMYEENPYPRYRHAIHIGSEFARTAAEAIKRETTAQKLEFPEQFNQLISEPKILIAGCGTGNQIINASRYKNAKITAIDLSCSSLAYAVRTSKEYKMNNISFKKMDLLKASELGEMFDIIECGGVLHHMDNPTNGLSALVQQLKPGGYIKLCLYSEIARKVIVDARKIIHTLGLESTPESIRDFRRKVLHGEIEELLNLPEKFVDFFSLSECRDLCFHVQEHRFTTDQLKDLLDAQGLIFCGFMLPDQVKKLYQEQYPEDNGMTSLKNWGKFEKENPSTFSAMYHFWTQKPF